MAISKEELDTLPLDEQAKIVAHQLRIDHEFLVEKISSGTRDLFTKVSAAIGKNNSSLFAIIDYQSRELVIYRELMWHIRKDTINQEILDYTLQKLDALNAEVQREFPKPAAQQEAGAKPLDAVNE